MKKPVIAVTPLWDDRLESIWMLPGYLDGLRAAGALPLMVPLEADEDDAQQIFSLCDGLLLTGGHDVDPAPVRPGSGALLRPALPPPGRAGAHAVLPVPSGRQAHSGHLPGRAAHQCAYGRHTVSGSARPEARRPAPRDAAPL